MKGTLCAVSISAFEQGNQAGKYAREILVNGKSPADIPIVPTEKGIPMINLSAARRLNIKPDAELLLISRIFQDTAIK
ncbi:MAG: ABC transporter substrate binding protein [Planctomycetes bacterium ADurb.Bin401]|nr:MAG: ABC transporter substrate binding protein [Planctomycetes bacterium ADurb.Bin401]